METRFVAVAGSLLVGGTVIVESSILAKARGFMKMFNGHQPNQNGTVVLHYPEADQVNVRPGHSYGLSGEHSLPHPASLTLCFSFPHVDQGRKTECHSTSSLAELDFCNPFQISIHSELSCTVLKLFLQKVMPPNPLNDRITLLSLRFSLLNCSAFLK